MNRFHHWISHIEIFKTRSHVDRFWRTFFSQKKGLKKPGEKTEPGARFFPFPKDARPCLSRNHNYDSRESKTVTLAKEKKTENAFCFFPFREAQPWLSRKHNRASRRSKTVTLAKEKKQKTRFFRFRKARSWLSLKHNRASRERKTVTFAKEKKANAFFRAKYFFFEFFLDRKANKDRGKTKTSKKPGKNSFKKPKTRAEK